VPDRPRSIWLRRERSGRGPVPEHGRDQIAAAAIELADSGGLDAVTTRKVAAAIGAGATSLYRYVENRDELLELMLDTACGELDLSRPPSGDWLADLIRLAHELRAMYRRHPWTLDIGQGPAPLTPNSVAFLEYALSILADVDAPAVAKMEAIALVNGMVMLTVRMEVATRGNVSAWQAAQVEYLSAIVADGRHPHLAAAFGSPASTNEGPELLDRTVRHLLHGVLGIT
jgi:AcrR family transcriptional regulator